MSEGKYICSKCPEKAFVSEPLLCYEHAFGRPLQTTADTKNQRSVHVAGESVSAKLFAHKQKKKKRR